MQYRLDIGSDTLLPEVHRRLLKAYGPLPPCLRLDPVSQLILALIGCRTPNQVSMSAFEALADEFATWEGLRDAPTDTIEKIIRRVTFPDRKATCLKATLRAISQRRGKLNLDFLADWRVEAARKWLESLPGVGPKVSAAVLNFSMLRKRALVADTHHLRVARRLGLLPASARADRAYRILMDQVPPQWTADDLDDHNTLMKRHGQSICRHTAPLCSTCAVRPLCRACPHPPGRMKRRRPIG